MPNQSEYIAIIDYQLSNMFSVKHVFDHLGVPAVITSDPGVVARAKAAVLPGVGAFGDAMENLRSLGLSGAITEFVKTRKLLGVCLGLQLVFAESEEFGRHKGLALVNGTVRKFPDHTASGEIIRVPQIGWNTLLPAQVPWKNSPFSELPEKPFVYFVHSYYVLPADPAIEIARTEYEGFEYCSAISTGNIFAVQFHPEKSGNDGISIYRQWVNNYV